MTKKTTALLLALALLLTSAGAFADNGYMALKALMETKYGGEALGTPIDAASLFQEIDGLCCAFIRLSDGLIGISGRNEEDVYEAWYFYPEDEERMLWYSYLICGMYRVIDAARTDSNGFLIIMDNTEGPEDTDVSKVLMIADPDLAEKIAEILKP